MLKNAIVVMFDSLGVDYVACYGNDWIRTPNMDRLAREGVLFENCYIEGLPTVPCRRAMHTGRFTLQKAGWVALTMEDTTIADLCWGRPIDTALIFDCPNYRLPKFGYTRGFDKVWYTHGHEADDHFYAHDPLYHARVMDYVDEKSRAAYVARVTEARTAGIDLETANMLRQRQYWRGPKDRYVAKTVSKAIEYLEQVDRNKQFYLWVDSFDPHEPWDPPSVYKYDENGNYDPDMKCPYDPDYKGKDEFLPYPDLVEGIYTEPQLHHVRMLHAELVTLCDEYLGKLMDAVRRLGFEENTLFWMVSDHGEPLGNGKHGHGLMRKVRPWPYEELVHAPSIMRFPGCPAGKRVKGFVQSCDVAPTVCDWLGIGVHPDMQGKSLLALARGEVDKVRDFAIAGYHDCSWSIITEDWTFIHWITKDKNDAEIAEKFYMSGVDRSHLKAVGGEGGIYDLAEASPTDNEAATLLKTLASVDGADQWTCTPGSSQEVPDSDELYDRRTDPYQLANVIAKHPDVARKLLNELNDFMAELSAS